MIIRLRVTAESHQLVPISAAGLLGENFKRVILNEYLNCEKELRIKVEETGKLKTKIKDLHQIIRLSEKLKEKDLETSDDDELVTETKEEGNHIPWTKSKTKKDMRPRYKSSPTKSTFMEKEYNCTECYFQGTKQMELDKHMNLKHRKVEADGMIHCNSCGEGFRTKWDLMNHRKSLHSETVANCRNFMNGNCPYSDEMCWWNHNKKQNESIKCYICSNTFENKTLLMSHRKINHGQLVKHCSQFQQNNCRFRSQACWFKHDEENDKEREDDDITMNDVRNERQSQPVFQKVSDNLDPPISKPEKKQDQQKL